MSVYIIFVNPKDTTKTAKLVGVGRIGNAELKEDIINIKYKCNNCNADINSYSKRNGLELQLPNTIGNNTIVKLYVCVICI